MAQAAQTESQNQQQRQAINGGVIFYPRNYVVDDNDFLNSYVEGVTLGGKEVVVFIEPTKANQEKARNSDTAQTIPTVDLFAETHRTAKNPCIASDENGPEKPCGVLMIEQVQIDMTMGHRFPGKHVLVGKWASVLQVDDQEAPFMTGKGYLETSFGFKISDELVELQARFSELQEAIDAQRISPMDAEEEKSSLYSKIMKERQKWFAAVLIKHEELTEIYDYTPDVLKNFIRFYLEKYTVDGMYGGLLVRVRDGDIIKSELCSSCVHKFDYTNRKVAEIDPIIDDYMKFYGNKALRLAKANESYVLEVIPVQRVNCGSTGNNKFGGEINDAPMGGSKTLKTYVEKRLRENPTVDFGREKGFTFANVGMRLSRVARGDGKGNLLLSTIHAFSAPQGNIFSIDKNGKSAYKMSHFLKDTDKK